MLKSEMGLRVATNHQFKDTISRPERRMNQPSTAHIASGGRLSTALVNNQNARFAYDELVSECADFLSSPVINDTVTQFAENILTLIESPTALDTPEVKRRIEQLLPVSHEYKHHRGMTISDRHCTRLCSLADRVINNAPYTNLNIVDENEDDGGETEFINRLRRSSGTGTSNHDVQYIRQAPNVLEQQELPKQLPSFVESNLDMEGEKEIEYDMDVTPYDSDVDEPARILI
jgi:hypothetical protein